MSENLKEEIARELGVYDQVKKDGGWENVSSKTCGNIVSKAIEIANRSVNSQFKNAKNISFDIFSIFCINRRKRNKKHNKNNCKIVYNMIS